MVPALRRAALVAACAALALLQGCVALAEREKTPSVALYAFPDAELAQLVPPDLAQDRTSAFRPLPFSAWSMDARLTLAQHAQKSLDLQYYLFQNDETGRALLRAVRDAALRGVRVRLLVDDLYTASSDHLLRGLAAYPNVEVRLFNPFPAGRAWNLTRWGLSLADLARLNHRMHNKLFVADGMFAVIGGRNIADEYFFRSMRGNFIDFDLLVAGEAVPELANTFDRYWNSRRVFTLDALEADDRGSQKWRDEFEALTASTRFPQLKPGERDLLNYGPLSSDIHRPPLKMLRGKVTVLADDPEKVSGRSEHGDDPTTVTSRVVAAMDAAKEDVLVASPYFVPGKAALGKIEQVRDKGVAFTIVTNTMAANDEPFVSAAYARYRKRMLKAGVQIYEVSPRILRSDDDFVEPVGTSTGRLHAKVLVIDHQTTFVGSMNMDFRSSRENTEIGVLVDSPELAADVIGLVDDLRASGTYRMRLSPEGEVQWVDSGPKGDHVFDSEPEVGALTWIEVLLFSPFIDEGLL